MAEIIPRRGSTAPNGNDGRDRSAAGWPTLKANADVMIAMNSEVIVVGMSYAMGDRQREGEHADEMHVTRCRCPIARRATHEPQLQTECRPRRATRADRLRAVWETKIATATDKTTSQGFIDADQSGSAPSRATRAAS